MEVNGRQVIYCLSIPSGVLLVRANDLRFGAVPHDRRNALVQGYRANRRTLAHETVNHSKDEYIRGDVTTNTVEGFEQISSQRLSLRIVKDDANGVAMAGADTADAMAQINAIGSARPLHRTVMHSKRHRVALPERHEFTPPFPSSLILATWSALKKSCP